MRRSQWMVVLALAGLVTFAPPAHASIGALVRAAARLGKAISGLAKGAKTAKGVGAAGKLVKGATLVGGVAAGARAARSVSTVSRVVLAERAAVLFASLPDDTARGAALLARDGDGWLLATRGTDELASATDLGRLLSSLDGPAGTTRLFVDPSGALSHAAELPGGARLVDATGVPRPWTVHATGAGKRAVPDATADEVLDAALDAADLASLGWDIAQVALDLGVNPEGGERDPRALKYARVGAPCGEGVAEPIPWIHASVDHLSAALVEEEPSRVLVFIDPTAPDLSPWLTEWATERFHQVVGIRVPDPCDAPTVEFLMQTARHDAYSGDRLPLVMVAPLDASSVRSEDPLLFCGETTLAPDARPEGVPTQLCWSAPTSEPPVVQNPAPAELYEPDPTEPPLWLYGVALLISIPVIVVMKRRGKLN